MLGVRNQRQKREQRRGMNPPVDLPREGVLGEADARHAGQIRDHQDKNQESDDARFGRRFPEPDRPDDEAAYEQANDGNGDGYRENRDEPIITRTEHTLARQQRKTEAGGEEIERDQGESAKAPEHEGVGQARERALANDLGL